MRSPTSTNSRAAWPSKRWTSPNSTSRRRSPPISPRPGPADQHTHLTHPGGIAANPTINLLGGKGLVVARGTVPSGNTQIAPAYHHLDVITAAPVQNNGKPELISTMLAQFAGSGTDTCIFGAVFDAFRTSDDVIDVPADDQFGTKRRLVVSIRDSSSADAGPPRLLESRFPQFQSVGG